MTKYEIILYWSEEDGAYIAEVPELAGCMADGETRLEALHFVTEQNLVRFFKGARSTRRKAAVPPPKYEADDFPPDVWESP